MFSKIVPHRSSHRVARFLKALTWATKHLGQTASPIVEMASLRSLPPNTFGRAWADHLDTQGLAPFAEGLRRQQLHDGIHVLTGYGTDLVGEAEVQAFLLGASFHLAHVVLMLGLLRGMHRHRHRQPLSIGRSEVRSRLQAAYKRGRCCQLDPNTWQPEILWEQPLSSVQKQFGL